MLQLGVALLAIVSTAMGIKGLSKNVIKQVWRDGRLQDLHDVRIGVDTAGWIHKAVVSNARDICLEVENSTKHHATFTARLQAVLHQLPSSSSIVLVLDGDRWPLKSGTHTRRQNARQLALERAGEADAASDATTADKYYRQAVIIPAEFVSWIIAQVKDEPRVSLVVAPYEADAQLAPFFVVRDHFSKVRTSKYEKARSHTEKRKSHAKVTHTAPYRKVHTHQKGRNTHQKGRYAAQQVLTQCLRLHSHYGSASAVGRHSWQIPVPTTRHHSSNQSLCAEPPA
jgi:hypothetical protein